MGRLAVAFAVVLLTGCGYVTPGQGSVTPGHGCTNIQIDWVDFIVVGTTQYVAGPQSPTQLQASDLGPIVAHVKFKVADNVCDPGYHPKDGDAAFLDPGTPIHLVNGRPASAELAAEHDGRIFAYFAISR